MRKKGRKVQGGAKRMLELGWKQVQLWLDPELHATLKSEAEREHRTLANYIKSLLACRQAR